MEKNYYRKYLKYKNKYLGLKYGGADEEGAPAPPQEDEEEKLKKQMEEMERANKELEE
jgi:hypothetical protein